LQVLHPTVQFRVTKIVERSDGDRVTNALAQVEYRPVTVPEAVVNLLTQLNQSSGADHLRVRISLAICRARLLNLVEIDGFFLIGLFVLHRFGCLKFIHEIGVAAGSIGTNGSIELHIGGALVQIGRRLLRILAFALLGSVHRAHYCEAAYAGRHGAQAHASRW
jgi:hypothetical protein